MSWAELVREKFLEIKNSNYTVDFKNISYAQLMSMLESHYNIPLLKEDTYIFDNKQDENAFYLWLEISNSRKFL